MRQRVAIATAPLSRPDLIIADEPTTALDVTIQGQILFEIQRLCKESGTSLIWITHDLSVVAGLADTISVMYAGRIVDSGPVAQVITQPHHPYTVGLLDSAPSRNQRGSSLRQIPGTTPPLLRLPSEWAFRDRCSRASAACQSTPEASAAFIHHSVCCFHPVETTSAEYL
jgi:peptide/nickel transport system ATP-binding protein